MATTANMGLGAPVVGDTVNVATDITDSMNIIDIHRHTGGAGGLTIQTGGLADDAVTAAKIADDIVTTAHLGVQVPAVIARQGGNATDWITQGTATQTVGAVRIQPGAASALLGAGVSGTLAAITFPTAFSAKPLVFVTSGDENIHLAVTFASVTATQFVVDWQTVDGSAIADVYVLYWQWLAMGSE